MLDALLVVAAKVGVLFILMSIGYACNKTGLLREPAVKGMTDLVLFVVTPCILVTAFQRDYEPALMGGLGQAFAVTLASNLVCITAAHALVRDPAKRRRRVLRFGLVFSNSAFMAVPLQQSLLGADGVFYGAAPIAVFNILLWTYGLALMGGADAKSGADADTKSGAHAGGGNGGCAGAGENGSGASAPAKNGIPMRKIILNPGMIGCALGVFFFLARVRLPAIIFEPMDWMGKLNTPLPMLIIGYYLAEANLKRIATDLRAVWVIFLRLAVTPLIILALLLLSGMDNTTMLLACMITSSAPVAASTTMFAAKFEQDTILSVELVAFSTLISIATMPVIIALSMRLFGALA